ncbi:hypothetical protein BN1708_000895 [Verticillium longisporum]|uniref:Uncharacterized protein n=1 Tax=Verticillium longisporum TaxID=100787 RepID=A0A0G4M7U1_VERLO|nr:hypothetical protein BN1708_000895 [Verticillium longisporum]
MARRRGLSLSDEKVVDSEYVRSPSAANWSTLCAGAWVWKIGTERLCSERGYGLMCFQAQVRSRTGWQMICKETGRWGFAALC